LGNAIQNATERAASQPKEAPAATPAAAPAAAPVALPANMTPDQIMARCPALPPVEQLVDDNSIRAIAPPVQDFVAQINALRDNAGKNRDAAEEATTATMEQNADLLVKQFTGYTAAEWDNMSQAESEAAVNRQIASAGTGNVDVDAVANVPEIQNEIVSIQNRWQETRRLIEADKQDAARQIAAIDARYAAQIKAIPRSEWSSGIGGSIQGNVHNAAERQQRDALVKACRTEQYTLWRNHVVKMQERVKTMMADVPRYNELMTKSVNVTGTPSAKPTTTSPEGYNIAITYIDAAREVTDLPGIERTGIEAY
jgi:hypothetical protein